MYVQFLIAIEVYQFTNRHWVTVRPHFGSSGFDLSVKSHWSTPGFSRVRRGDRVQSDGRWLSSKARGLLTTLTHRVVAC